MKAKSPLGDSRAWVGAEWAVELVAAVSEEPLVLSEVPSGVQAVGSGAQAAVVLGVQAAGLVGGRPEMSEAARPLGQKAPRAAQHRHSRWTTP